MGNSVFLARLIGPLMLAVGIGIFVNGATYRMLADEFLRSRALIYLSGLLTMTAGLALILTHNVWRADWPVIITILGWLAAIGGAVRIIAPQGTERSAARCSSTSTGSPSPAWSGSWSARSSACSAISAETNP